MEYRINENWESVKLGRVEVLLNNCKLVNGESWFTRRDAEGIMKEIGEGWRLPTEEEFEYIHSIYTTLKCFQIFSRNTDYWLFGESMRHPVHPQNPMWNLYPKVVMNGDAIEFVASPSGDPNKIRLVRDL
jgi:hypothetical protein